MITWVIIMFAAFIGLLVLASIKSYQKNRSSQEFMLAGSSLGVFLGFMTFSAALFSAFTFQGMPDFFRTHGIGAWIFLAFSDGVMVFFILWFGRKLRRKAKEKGFKGIAGLMADIYGTKWAGYALFLSSFLFLIPYAAIQIRGISVFFDAAFPNFLPRWGWSLILVVFMILYAEIGGFKAMVYSDAIQGTILLVVLWLIATTCITKLGGVQSMFEQVQASNEALLSTPGPKGLFTWQFLTWKYHCSCDDSGKPASNGHTLGSNEKPAIDETHGICSRIVCHCNYCCNHFYWYVWFRGLSQRHTTGILGKSLIIRSVCPGCRTRCCGTICSVFIHY